jgi:hypothetical protein
LELAESQYQRSCMPDAVPSALTGQWPAHAPGDRLSDCRKQSRAEHVGCDKTGRVRRISRWVPRHYAGPQINIGTADDARRQSEHRLGNPFIEQFCTAITLRTSLGFLDERRVPHPEKSARRTEYFDMTNKITTPRDTKKQAKVTHPGMMGDGTEEQNLGERGNPKARIKKEEVAAAFGRKRPAK